MDNDTFSLIKFTITQDPVMDNNVEKKLWLSPEELEVEFGIKRSTQNKMRMRKAIPYSKIGAKVVRYNRDRINQWLSDAKVV